MFRALGVLPLDEALIAQGHGKGRNHRNVRGVKVRFPGSSFALGAASRHCASVRYCRAEQAALAPKWYVLYAKWAVGNSSRPAWQF